MRRSTAPKTRAALLQRVIGQLAISGLGSVSLRGVAKALGLTPTALLHHFGSKAEMIRAVVDELEREQMDVVEKISKDELSLEKFICDMWAIQSSKAQLARIRLQLEAVTIDATETGLPGAIRAKVMSVWVESLARRLEAQGYDRHNARNNATLVHAAFVGLLMDLLATGDRARLDAACAELGRVALSIERKAPGRVVSDVMNVTS